MYTITTAEKIIVTYFTTSPLFLKARRSKFSKTWIYIFPAQLSYLKFKNYPERESALYLFQLPTDASQKWRLTLPREKLWISRSRSRAVLRDSRMSRKDGPAVENTRARYNGPR